MPTSFQHLSPALLQFVALLVATGLIGSRGSPQANDASKSIGGPHTQVWVDYDRDGLVDLYLVPHTGADRLLRNAGNGVFDDVTDYANLEGARDTSVATWHDFDGDGLEDLLRLTRSGSLRLYRGATSRVFEDVSSLLSEASTSRVVEAGWVDQDGDGSSDLWLETTSFGPLLLRGSDTGGFQSVIPVPDAAWIPKPAPGDPRQPSATPDTRESPRRTGGNDAPNGLPDSSASESHSNGWSRDEPAPAVPGATNAPNNLSTSCSPSLVDVLGGACIEASSSPQLGMLYPLSSNLFVAQSSGYVGLGTTAPLGRLHTRTASQWSSSNYGANIVIDGTRNNAIALLDAVSANPWAIANTSGNLTIAKMPALGNTTSAPAPHFSITAAGDVGIGATSPLGRLHARTGPAWSSSNYGPSVVVDGTRNNALALLDSSSSNPWAIANTGGSLTIAKMPALGNITTGPTRHLIVAPTGEVGVGATSPKGRLHTHTGPQWSSFNYGAGVVIDGTRNNAIALLDSSSSNPWAIANTAGSLTIAKMPALGNTTAAPTRHLVITSAGDIGIGTVTPGSKLTVSGVVESQAGGFKLPDGTVIDSGSDLGASSWTVSGSNVYRVAGNVGIGTASPAVKLHVNGRARVGALEIVGGADVAEPFNTREGEAVAAGMVLAIDVETPGGLCIARTAYDTKVAGIVSGAGGVAPGVTLRQEGSAADGELPVALTGRAWALCDADAGGAIQPGDLLTTSETPGHAMRVTDGLRAHGAVLGKAMTGLGSGRGLVLVLVSLQ